MVIKDTRAIGKYTTGANGPLLFISAGVHGNEPSGVIAFERVLKVLTEEQPAIKGQVLGIYGNKEALKKEVRYIDEDLNRTWTKKNVDAEIRNTHEKKEMFDIIGQLKEVTKNNAQERYFLDCHTTSSDSIPYISVQEVGTNDQWAHRFPTYIIRGFSDIVSGCIDHYMSRSGLTGFVFEGGQHDSPDAVDHHEAMIWLAIAHACDLDLERLQTYPASVAALEKRRANRKTMEIIYRHALEDGDNFTMEPGYENFQPIQKGELLATHNGKKIHSEYNAYIFMPLYQSQGNDGFFVVKDVSPAY